MDKVTLNDRTVVLTDITEFDTRQGLIDLIRAYGHDPDLIRDADKEVIAAKLSEVARRKKPWGRDIITAVKNGRLQAGREFTSAVMALLREKRGEPVPLTRGTPVQVLAVGDIHPGSIVFGSSRVCANPACGVTFVTDIWNKRCCCPDCSKAARKARHAAR